jgi:hypothetical protein
LKRFIGCYFELEFRFGEAPKANEEISEIRGRGDSAFRPATLSSQRSTASRQVMCSGKVSQRT